jgi:hypothetical protein
MCTLQCVGNVFHVIHAVQYEFGCSVLFDVPCFVYNKQKFQFSSQPAGQEKKKCGVVLLFEMTSVVETPTSLIYVIEHMETNLSEWVRNEYTRMVKDVGGGNLLFTNMKPGTNCPSFDSDEMSFLSTATLVSETFQEYHDAKDGDRTKAVLLDEKSGMSCTRWLVQLLFPC